MTFSELLLKLQGPLIETALGIVIYALGEYVPAETWRALAPKWKRLVYLCLCLGVPLASAFVSAALGYQPNDFELTYWPALSAGAVVFAASQAAHLPKLGKLPY